MPPSLKPSPTRRCGRAPWTKASIFPHGTSRRRRRSLPFRRQRSRNGGRSSRRRASKASESSDSTSTNFVLLRVPGDDERFGSFASLRRAARLRRMSAMPSIATESVRLNEPTRSARKRHRALFRARRQPDSVVRELSAGHVPKSCILAAAPMPSAGIYSGNQPRFVCGGHQHSRKCRREACGARRRFGGKL